MSGRTHGAYRWWHVPIAWMISAGVEGFFAIDNAVASLRAMFLRGTPSPPRGRDVGKLTPLDSSPEAE